MHNLSVIIPYFNGRSTIKRLIESIPSSIPIIIVDDLSDEPLTLAPLQLSDEYSNVRIVRPEQKGYFSGACNHGIDLAGTDVLILNQDAYFENNGWMKLIEENRREYAVIGDGVMKHPAWENGYVQGTFMFIRRDAWMSVGKFNVEFYPLWGSTCEWQLRACRASFKAMPMSNVPGLVHRERKRRFGSAIGTMLRRQPNMRRLFLRTPPEITVVIPCYNYGRFLDDAIHSLLGGPTSLGQWSPQSFQSFEIIIVDDASTDRETREKVASLHDPWQGIRVVQLEKNQGTPSAINQGVTRAYGEYVHILSADDMREEWCLEKFYRHQVENPGSVIYGDIQLFANGDRLRRFPLPEYDFDKLLLKNCMPAGVMYPRQAWVEAGGYPERMVYGREDWAFNVALGAKGYCGVKMEGLSGNLYRREGHNRSVRTANRHQHEAVRESDPAKAQGWRRRFLNQMMAQFPELYQGERPVGCCGGNRRSRTPSNRVPRAAMADARIPGRDGFTVIEYIGGNKGSSTFFGEETGTRYVFGDNKKDRVGYVDSRDADAILGMLKSGKPLFSIYVAPDPKPAVKVSKEEAKEVNDPDPPAITPGARRFLEREGYEEIPEITGTGKNGKITIGDVRQWIAQQN